MSSSLSSSSAPQVDGSAGGYEAEWEVTRVVLFRCERRGGPRVVRRDKEEEEEEEKEKE